MSDSKAALEHRLKDRDPHARFDAALQLAQQGSAVGHGALRAGLKHEDPMVRSRAAYLIGQIGGAWTIKPLAEQLNDPIEIVRNEVIFALMNTYHPAAVPHLLKALEDEDSDRVEDARVALVTLLGPKMGALLAEIEEDVEEEAELARAWWAVNASRFDPNTRYDRGKPVSVGRWVDELESAPPELLAIISDRLTTWTGEDWQSGPGIDQTWRVWWQTNAERFPPGRRYYWGHPDDSMPN